MGISLVPDTPSPFGPYPPPWPNMNLQTWVRLLNLATRYGWSPEETPPATSDVSRHSLIQGVITGSEPVGTYGPGARLEKAEARSLADALANALEDIPRFEAGRDKIDTSLGMPEPAQGQSVNLVEWFSGAGRRVLEQTIALGRFGAFTVQAP